MGRLSAMDALLIVDVQRDFLPGGALPVPGGDAVIPVLNEWIAAARAAGAFVFASRDWHPPGHVSFRERGGPWPPHCIQGTAGAAFSPALRLPADAVVIDKGSEPDREAYSAFDGTGLAGRLRGGGCKTLWIGGLALDFCVRATALDARRHGLPVRLLLAATRPIAEASGQAAIRDLLAAGVAIEPSGDRRDGGQGRGR